MDLSRPRSADTAAFWCALRAQEPEAYEELARRVATHCVPVFRREGVSAERVEALAQDVLVSVWTFAGRHARPPGDLGAFLYWRARGVWSRHARRARSLPDEPAAEDPLSPATPEPLESLVLDELARAIRDCCNALENDQRRVWRARQEAGLGPRETAAQLGFGRAKVALLLHRARKRVAACLERKKVLP